MILRAQLKPIEEIPEESFCCEASRKSYTAGAIKGKIIEIETGILAKYHCSRCGQIKTGGVLVHGLVDGRQKSIDPRMWDIEEAPGGEGPGDSHEQA